MRFTLSALTFLSVVYAAAVPQPIPSTVDVERIISAEEYTGGNHTTGVDHIDKRTPGNVFLCTAAGFTGTCVTIPGATNGGCVDLAGDLDNLVSSFGPDAGQTCWVFDAHGCSTSAPFTAPIVFPGVADLSQMFRTADGVIRGPFNDMISSYQCFFL
ncbi:hypothetical protein C8J57DRAFT_1466525 [Mycena rebaudengoi]|nr:hypothetical protein C8J57DRAFT_1466525 [Mycena rebaudengoi]